MKNEVNKTLMLQLGGREENIAYDHFLQNSDTDESDPDLES